MDSPFEEEPCGVVCCGLSGIASNVSCITDLLREVGSTGLNRESHGSESTFDALQHYWLLLGV